MRKAKSIGEHFGFPECCINGFINKEYELNSSLYKELMSKTAIDGTGYMPCVKHLKLLADKVITMDEVLNKRICKYSFPNAGEHGRCTYLNRCCNWH